MDGKTIEQYKNQGLMAPDFLKLQKVPAAFKIF